MVQRLMKSVGNNVEPVSTIPKTCESKILLNEVILDVEVVVYFSLKKKGRDGRRVPYQSEFTGAVPHKKNVLKDLIDSRD